MKLFRTILPDVIKECRCFFGITDTKLLIAKRKMKFLRNKKYVLSNSESIQCNFFIFDHVTFIQFKISKSAAVYKISWKSDFKNIKYF